ncbi:MAG: type IV pilus assembly protein PilP [Gammaproteobacteria bacterium]|nr:MAG: type IV pilus assembly protein PilP [Gammaproteobacteria bacterium]TND03975.1 MAG: type IV pilus assembly protein PilP [Gammaproteobacteria bacterium]
MIDDMLTVTKGIKRGALTFAIALVLLTGLTACSSDNLGDLRSYIDEVKARKGGRIDPVPEFRPFETAAYGLEGQRDPFTPSVLRKPDQVAASTGQGLQPDLTRRKEALEDFPLDSLKMAGVLESGNQRWAIITAPDGVIYRVRNGNYIGQNNGKIVEVTEQKMSVTEIVPDGLGGWRIRESTVALIQ